MKKWWFELIMEKIYNPNHVFKDRKSFYEYLDWVGIDNSLFFEERWRNQNELWTIWEWIDNIVGIIQKDWTVIFNRDWIEALKVEIEKTASLLASTLSDYNRIPEKIILNSSKQKTASGKLEYQIESNEFTLVDWNGWIKFKVQDLKQFKEKIKAVSIDEEWYKALVKRWEKFLLDHISNESVFIIKKTSNFWEEIVELWFEKNLHNQIWK